jgi:hypothetical protein
MLSLKDFTNRFLGYVATCEKVAIQTNAEEAVEVVRPLQDTLQNLQQMVENKEVDHVAYLRNYTQIVNRHGLFSHMFGSLSTDVDKLESNLINQLAVRLMLPKALLEE